MKSHVFKGKVVYTPSYTHYPQEKWKNREDFMVTKGTFVLYKSYKNQIKEKKEHNLS